MTRLWLIAPKNHKSSVIVEYLPKSTSKGFTIEEMHESELHEHASLALANPACGGSR